MAGESEMSLPTNDELYRWICRNEAPPEDRNYLPGQIEAVRTWWQELKQHSKDNDLLEAVFDGDCKAHFHERFWELYLPKAFATAGIALNRGKSGQPDFNFEKHGQKIWIEAVACGEPTVEHNKVPPPGDDFESGLNSAFENQTMQRLATAISLKINGFQKKQRDGIVQAEDIYVIALNGWRALNGQLQDSVWAWGQSVPQTWQPPFIVRMLFGMGDQFLQLDPQSHDPIGVGFQQIGKIKLGAPIAHFTKPENSGIAGVLYSAANIFETRRDILGHDFIFIPNPYAKDVSSIFNSMQVRESLAPGAGLKPLPIRGLDAAAGRIYHSAPKKISRAE
jgi:hypothetical protein